MTAEFADEAVAQKAAEQAASKSQSEPGDAPTLAQVVTHWPWLAAISVSVVLIVLNYFRSDLFSYWWNKWMEKDSYYSHGVLIPFISAFAVYLDRRTLAKMPVSPSFLGLIFLAPAALVALVAHTADTPSILGLSLPAVIFGAAWLLLGTAIAWRLVFPIWFLSFMCVLPGFVLTTMSFKIQLLSTSGAALILRIIGLHPEQHGAAIKLANAEVLVGQPCSGFRLLISLLAFAIFFAYMREGPRWGKLVLVISTAPLSLFVNSVRIFMIALVGEFFGNEAMHAFHDYSGYLVLVLAFAVLWQLSKVVKCEKFKAVLIS